VPELARAPLERERDLRRRDAVLQQERPARAALPSRESRAERPDYLEARGGRRVDRPTRSARGATDDTTVLSDEPRLPQPPDDPAGHYLPRTAPLGSSVEEHLLQLEPGEIPERREEHERPHLPRPRGLPRPVQIGRASCR